MKVLVNSDSNLKADARTMEFVQAEVDRALERFEGRLTRVELHLSDMNGHKSGGHLADKRCVIEARPAGAPPVSVTHDAANLKDAISEAASKMKRLLETTFGKEAHSSRESIRHVEAL